MAVGTESDRLGGVTHVALLVAAVAVAHVGALVAFPAEPALRSVVVLELLAVAVVAVGSAVSDGVGPGLGIGALVALAIALTWGAVLAGTPLTTTALGLVAGLLVVGYGVHRYELVALGLVEADDE